MGNGVTAWSYSRYADYQQCPLKFKLKVIDKMREPGSAAMDRGSAIHKEGENYVLANAGAKRPKAPPKSYAHFAEEMKQLTGLDPMVEQQWGFTDQWAPATASGRDPHGWFAKDTWLRLVTDVCVRYDDGDVDIIDYKTGKMYGKNEEQMNLFSCGPFMKWPDTQKVTTRLWYLDQPDPTGTGANRIEEEYTRKDFELIKKDWVKKVRPMFADQKFAPKPNDRCRWCHFRKENGGPCKF